MAIETSMKARHRLKPPKTFDFSTVQERLEGVLLNVDRDLQTRAKNAARAHDFKTAGGFSLFEVIVRFAHNSFHAVGYVAGDVPEDHRRKLNYVLVVPNINRQLLDLLFSLVYMLDDFDVRSHQYKKAGWRELKEEHQQYRNRFGKDSGWRDYFENVEKLLEAMSRDTPISAPEEKKPKLVPFWKHPFDLSEEPTKSRPYLRYLNKWLYGDTSAQAHLSYGGLVKVAGFLTADLIGGEHQEFTERRTIQHYRFQQISRTAVITLAIATEVDSYCRLGNGERIDYLWTVFSEYVAEAKEMWDLRYRVRNR